MVWPAPLATWQRQRPSPDGTEIVGGVASERCEVAGAIPHLLAYAEAAAAARLDSTIGAVRAACGQQRNGFAVGSDGDVFAGLHAP